MERSATAWHLVIELLADLKQIEIPVLQAAIGRTTGFCNASGAVKEKVALRYLEKFSDSSGEASTSGSDARIDEELSAEEVLCHHVRKEGTSKISRKSSRAKWSRYELEHFILQKKPMLPKCSLDLVKESILKGQSQLLLVLKDYSVLAKWCEVDKRQSNGGTEKEHMEKLKLRTADEILTPQQQAPVSEPETGIVVLRDDPSRTQQHLSKQNDGANADRRDQLQRVSVGTGGEISELLLHNSSPQMADKEKGALHQSPLVAVKENEDQPIHKEGHSVGGHCVILEAPADGDCCYGLTVDVDPSGDTLGFQKGGPKSQISVNIDSITGDGIRKGSCIKCKKGGPLLICSTKGCIVTAHEGCFGSVTPNFDEKGLFCCPFCSFKIASLAYCRAKKNLSQAEKALKDFSGWDFVTRVNENKTSGMEVSRGESHEHEANSMQAAEIKQMPAARVHSEGDKVFDNDGTANNHQKIVQFQHFQQAGGANIVNHGGMPHNATGPPACKIAEINSTNKEKRIGGEGFVLKQVHDLAEPHAVDGTRENHYEILQSRHFQQFDAANLANDSEVLHNAPVPPAWNTAEANHNDKEREDGDECGTLEEVHNSAKACAVNDTRNHQQEIMQLQHLQQTCVANRVNDGNVPYATDPPAFEIAEANHIEEVKQTGDGNQNVSYQEVDMLQHGNTDGAVEHGKDIGIHQKTIMEVQNGKKTSVVANNGIPCSPNQELGSSATTERHAKKRKLDLDIENNPPAGTTVDDENRVKSSPRKLKECQSRPKRRLSPTFPYSRRNRIHWTSEEEEILKAGVKKFARGSEAFPWARILEFGQGIFHENRLPADLKDKWRNIRIREDKAKRTPIKDF